MNEEHNQSANFLVSALDRVVVGVVRILIVLTELKSRDPHEHPAHLLKPDPRQPVKIRGWRGVLEWPPGKRVGCFAGVSLGVLIGGAILWYGIQDGTP